MLHSVCCSPGASLLGIKAEHGALAVSLCWLVTVPAEPESCARVLWPITAYIESWSSERSQTASIAPPCQRGVLTLTWGETAEKADDPSVSVPHCFFGSAVDVKADGTSMDARAMRHSLCYS